MRILLIGGSGQLGTALKGTIDNSQHEIKEPDSKLLNICDRSSVNKYFLDYHPDIVINCAAYTNVERAEIDQKKSLEINSNGPEYLSLKTYELGAYLIHISTDYVFGSSGKGPYSNGDKTGPINHYGYTKREGEKRVISNTEKFLIIRTASLVSSYESNFVSKVVFKLQKGENINVVENQYISMTCSEYLANFICKILTYYPDLLPNSLSNNQIVHYTNAGFTNWFSIASRIQDKLFEKKVIESRDLVKPIRTEDWASKAKRPSDSRLLVNNQVNEILDIVPVRWEDGLDKIIDESTINE